MGQLALRRRYLYQYRQAGRYANTALAGEAGLGLRMLQQDMTDKKKGDAPLIVRRADAFIVIVCPSLLPSLHPYLLGRDISCQIP